jgi:DNA-binding transcriptional LysR family regulator
VFDELRRAAQDLALVESGAKGSLRVGTMAMPAIPFLPLAIKRLIDDHPEIFVSVVEGREAEIIDRLRKRDIDVAILRLSLVEPADDMQAATLFEEKLCVVAAKDHPLATRTDLTWAELLDERWVMPPADGYFFEHVLRTLDRQRLETPRHVVEAASVGVQVSLVLHAAMLSFGMRSQVEFAPGKALLARLPFELGTRASVVAAVTLSANATSPLVEQFVGHVRALVAGSPPLAESGREHPVQRRLEPRGQPEPTGSGLR